ncbi:MAG: undecaprenyl/decaprenyl-phosphate alpha-N-acetylglucosaminyl 1-phosphate transferase [Phycisphaerales bacterium]|nr:MAG: undecaprenyl/decaprenyl-phosphate alpha-N-acetylglucosaminyl 1-phosphate transferase [Phycisphaerales bacterium]
MPEHHTTVWDVCRTYWPILACSFLVSFAATPLCRRYALRRKIVDRPDDFLKPHKAPVPYLGGVAIFLGWAAGVLLAFALFEPVPEVVVRPRVAPTMDTTMMAGIFVAGLAIMLLGLFDDLRMAAPWFKLVGAAAVALLLILVGLGNDTILIVLRSTGLRLDDLQPWLVLVYSVPLTLFITIGACNATNLIDGIDGLCSGVLGIISAGFLVLAVHLHVWGDWYPWDVERVTLSLAMMGAALGFLPYNRSPARIFMGDAGSMLLGLNAAILILLFTKSNAIRWLLASVMVFGLPLADMILTLVRRWRNQRPLMRGDRSHFYDQLLDRGWPLRRVVTISYVLAGFFAVMGCISIALRTRYILLLYPLVIAGVIGLVARFKMVRLESPQQSANIPDRCEP